MELRVLFTFVFIGVTSKLNQVNSMSLPSYLKPCKLDSNFNSCMTKNGNLAIPTLVKGDPKWKIPVLDPLSITSISITENNAKNIALNVTLTDLKITGLKDAKLISSNFDDKKMHLQWITDVPKLTLKSKYLIDGKFLILPITGAGPLTVTLDNVKLIYNLDYKLFKKNNVDYLQITKSDLKYTTTRLHVNFENLFNGDKILGANTNNLINENWQEFNSQLGPSVASPIGSTLTQILANIAKSVPFNTIITK